MRAKGCAAFVLAVLALVVSPARARQQQPPANDQGNDTSLELSGEEVLLDLVAVDGKGKPVLDLKPEEIEIYEKGKKQAVTSFKLVQTGPLAQRIAETPGSLPAALAQSPLRDYNLVMIVLDRTSLNDSDLKLIYNAAAKFVNERLEPNDLVGVFGLSRNIAIYQNFTNDKARLLSALKLATSSNAPIAGVSQPDQIRSFVLSTGLQTDPGQTSAIDPNSSGSTKLDPNLATQQLDEIAQGVNQVLDTLRARVQSRFVIQGLLALTKAYSRIPGRKSVLFYSSGFPVDSTVEGVFMSSIGLANRNNFVFYTVDAAGLRTAPAGQSAFSDPRSVGSARPTGDPTLVVGGNSALGRAEQELKSSDNAALERLANSTGGISLRNSNDLNRGFEAVQQDLRSYYALAYAPADSVMDGSFRNVSVKVLRKGVDIRTRSGYYAVPGADTLVIPYEIPILTMFETAPKSNDLAVGVRAVRFRTEGGWLVRIVVSVEGASLAPVLPDPKAKDANPDALFEADALAVVVDRNRHAIAKVSAPTSFRLSPAGVDQFKAMTQTLSTFPDPLVLAPGSYTIRVGIYDPIGKKGSIVERELVLPQLAGSGPVLSSLVLSHEIEAVGADPREADDPLVFGGKARIVPSADGRFSKSRGDKFVPFVRVYGAPNTQYEAKMVFTPEGQVGMATKAAPLPVTDAKGEAGFAPVLPLDAFPPGNYTAQMFLYETGKLIPIAEAKASFTVVK